MEQSLRPLLDEVIALVGRAGEAVLEIYRAGPGDVILKADASPLTLADQRSHLILQAGLEALQVGPVLSEEGRSIPFPERRGWHQYWLVDPLDGTKEFIKRNGEFTVNVALVRDGVPVLGVVGVPALGETFYGAQDVGAFRIAGQGLPPVSLRTGTKASDFPWRVTGSRSHGDERTAAFLSGLGAHAFLPLGSSLKLCRIAEGAMDLYPRFGPTSEWDIAAAQCVLEQAGGAVLDWESGQPLRYNQRDSLRNGAFVALADPRWFGMLPRV
ncbi:MAG: cysQ 2 [Rhodocyclaceae bacterium]|nr:cysQ 2 [Rhodocyclaceae bacterium]